MQTKKLTSDYQSINENLQAYAFENSQNILKNKIQKEIAVIEEFLIYTRSMRGIKKGKLFREIIKECEIAVNELELLKKDLLKPFLLFVVGMGKYGKSTLINSLLKQNIAEIGVLPKTWKIDIYQKRENDNQKVKIILNDGTQKKLNSSGAKVFLDKEEKKIKLSEEAVYDKFRKNERKLKTIEEKEEYKKALEKDLLYKSPVIEVIWPLEERDILKNFRLVDTPGLIQELFGDIKVSINDYYYKADGVIWLLDATKISANKPQEMINDLDKSLETIGGRTDNIVAVLNRIDIIKKQAGPEGFKSVYEKANKICKGAFNEIIPISAKDALKGSLEEDKELIESSRINDLKRYIKDKFLTNAKEIQLQSKNIAIEKIKKRLYEKIKNYEDRLDKDNKKIKHFEKSLNNELMKLITNKINEKNLLLQKYAENVKKKINKNVEFLLDKDKGKEDRDNIINDMFNIKNLEVKLRIFNSKLGKSINKLIQYSRDDAIISEYRFLSNKSVISKFNSNIKLPAFKDNFEFSSLEAQGGGAAIGTAIGLILGPIGALIGGALGWLIGIGISSAQKEEKINKLKKELIKKLNKLITQLKRSQKTSIKQNTNNAGKYLTKLQAESFKELHFNKSQIESVLEILENLQNKIKSEKTISNYEILRDVFIKRK